MGRGARQVVVRVRGGGGGRVSAADRRSGVWRCGWAFRLTGAGGVCRPAETRRLAGAAPIWCWGEAARPRRRTRAAATLMVARSINAVKKVLQNPKRVQESITCKPTRMTLSKGCCKRLGRTIAAQE